MARGQRRVIPHGWWSEPPWWAWVAVVVGFVFLVVGMPLAADRGSLSAEEVQRIEGKLAAEQAAAASAEAAAEAAAAEEAARTGGFALLQQQDRPFTIGIVGDSTGNAPGEWVHLWAEHLGAAAARPVVIHDWDIDQDQYKPETTEIGTGSAATIEVWNGSASGMAGSYSLEHAATLLPGQPDVVLYNHAHNEGSDDAAFRDISAVSGWLASQWETAPKLFVILQPERTSKPAPHDESVEATRRWAEAAGVGTVDVRAAFAAHGDLASLLQPDGVHPNEAGSRLWAETVTAALPVQ